MNKNRDIIIENIGIKRFNHSLRVMDVAIDLARLNNINLNKAKIAGYYHDCAKFLDKDVLLKKACDFGIIDCNIMVNNIELIHGPLGAKIAEKEFGIVDKDILNAIEYHTTGRKNMSKLEKVIYLADYIEPVRNFPGVEIVRKKAYEDLDLAILLAIENTIKFLIEKKQSIDLKSIEARNQILETIDRRDKMMEKINTPKAPAAIGPYSQGIKIENLVFTSGQLPIDMETGLLVENDIEKATAASLDNVKAILEESGSSLEKVIKVTVYVTNMEDFGLINGVYEKYFTDHKPARSLVEVKALPKGASIEIEAIGCI